MIFMGQGGRFLLYGSLVPELYGLCCSKLFINCFGDESIQCLLMGSRINGSPFMAFTADTNIEAAFISDFRFVAFFFT